MDDESEDTSSTSDGHKLDIEQYRKLVRFYLDSNANESALFWADKVVSLSDGEPQDVYWLAQCMYRSGQYHRALAVLRNRGLDKSEPLCQWLAGKALLDAKQYSDALVVLLTEEEQAKITRTHPSSVIGATNLCHTSTPPIDDDCILEGFTKNGLRSAILLLKGQIFEKMDNRSRAADCFKEALKLDIYCFEAFQLLIQHHSLSTSEERELLSSLPIKEQCGEGDLLPNVYDMLVNKYQNTAQLQIQTHPSLLDNMDMAVARAERLYYACAYEECFNLAESLLERDPYHPSCLTLFISCLVELKRPTRLFRLAHDLVDIMPDKAISWFAVGCYYYLIGKRDPARRYLGKATSIDKLFGPAWLAYGHSFAVEGEHDQAMATYFSATKLMKGCHLPLMYIGLECGLTNNVLLAERFFLQAQSIAPYDPFVIHEIGVIAFQNHDYSMAEKHFLTALSYVHEINQPIVAEKWEALLNNLGHTSRKLKKYDEALRYHQQALVVSPQNASTLSSIGFVYALKKNFGEAIEMFHKSLFLRRDDSFTLSMLAYTIEINMEQTEIIETTDSNKIPDSYMPLHDPPPKCYRGKKKSTSPNVSVSTDAVAEDPFAYSEHLNLDLNVVDADYAIESIVEVEDSNEISLPEMILPLAESYSSVVNAEEMLSNVTLEEVVATSSTAADMMDLQDENE